MKKMIYLLSSLLAILIFSSSFEVKPVLATSNVVRIINDNLQVCTAGTCTLIPPVDKGNLIVENKLGIGIGTPGSLLDVQGAAEFGANNLLITGTDTTNPYIDLAVGDTGSGGTYGRGIILRRGRTGTGASNWANIGLINDTTLGIGMLQSVGTATGIMTINSSGQVGIGNTSPAQILQVGSGTYPAGTFAGINVAANGASYVTVSDNTRQVFLSADSSGYGFTGTYSNHDFVIRTNNVESVRVAANGNVGISASGAAPGAKLDVNGAIKTLGTSLFAQSDNTNTAYNTAPIQLREAQYGGTSGYLAPRLSFHWGGVVASQIGIESGGRLAILNNPGTGYENLIGSTIYANSNFLTGTGSTGTGINSTQFYCNNSNPCYYNYSGTGTTYISNAQNTIIGNVFSNLGIGVSPSYKLDVAGNANVTNSIDMSQNTRLKLGQAYLSSGGNYAHLATNVYFNGASWVETAPGIIFQLAGASGYVAKYQAGVWTTWALVTGTGGWSAGSSRQFKQNIKELTRSDLDLLQEQFLVTPLFSYNRKDKPEEPEVGFIAEEAPEYILDGSDKTQVTLMKGIGYLAIITKGQENILQDQKETIASLEKIVKQMQNEISSLK